MAKRNPRTGSRFDAFLKEEGIFEEVRRRHLSALSPNNWRRACRRRS